ncbi:hypothetical protein CMEL01_08097 [Colletotrichum melonis]|uniref:Uncharacterized protein n=1 Tax=Colletotrichum melonis TaxID=1209925 RepID=A0AAI9TZB8_9PEZI|nr:hypothetical protein CMEL01_08097 [Colletotrichum melonis]
MPPKAMIFGLESRDFGGLRGGQARRQSPSLPYFPSFNDSSSLTGVNYTGRLPLYSSTARLASTCLFRNVIGRNKTPGRRSLPVAPSVVRKKKSSATFRLSNPQTQLQSARHSEKQEKVRLNEAQSLWS